MKATLTRERFEGPDWLFERKLDGIRLVAYKDARGVRLMTRNEIERSASYPEIARAVAALPVRDAILDGEAMGMFGGRGVADGYHVFDLLWLDGKDLTALPLRARKELMAGLAMQPPLHRTEPLTEARPWERACAEGWEGVIAKRADSPYEHKRSRHWLKMKCEAGQELVIGGFTDPEGARVGLGALLVGYFEGDDFVFAGKVGTGFDTQLLRTLRAQLGALEIDKAPFTKGKGLPRSGVHWAKPELVVEVAFMEWTGHGKLRHPRLVRMRDDKPAREVTREAARE
jgi:bifunctional non-homologous end joining protein LigD